MSDLAAARGSGTDAGLVRRAQSGDHDAFTALIDGRVEPAFRTAMAILGNEADARDATQDTFLRAWRSLADLREPEHFSAWLGRILVNTCRTAIRGRRRRLVREVSVGTFPADADDDGYGPAMESPAESTADIDLVARALDRISASDRSLLALHHYQHLPLEQIGLILGVPAKTIKSRLFSARRPLERALEMERR